MSRIFPKSSLLAAIVFVAATASAQQIEREFGWSIKVEPSELKKAERRQPVKTMAAARPDEIRVETDLVLSDLLVQDKNGVPVSGLKAADFEITENGAPQSIDVFAYGDSSIPRSIFLVIDHSLSQLRYIDLSIASAKILVDSMRSGDRMAIVSDDVELISDLTSDKAQLKSALEYLRVKCNSGKFGKSSQYTALFAALNERIERNGSRNIVIFQTDGDELAMLRRTRASGTSNFGIDDIVSLAERKGVTIYTVFTGRRLSILEKNERFEQAQLEITEQARASAAANGKPAPERPPKLSRQYILSRIEGGIADEKAVASVAEKTGGVPQSLESPNDASAVYDRILSDIGQRYLIGYYPTERAEAAVREREVRIVLRNKGNFRVIGGRTYVTY